uniref:Uncharacterized protein n=1 Tax=Arundo donax TaxID=35708 RepID=A0A0A9FWY0_ARUDO
MDVTKQLLLCLAILIFLCSGTVNGLSLGIYYTFHVLMFDRILLALMWTQKDMPN